MENTSRWGQVKSAFSLSIVVFCCTSRGCVVNDTLDEELDSLVTRKKKSRKIFLPCASFATIFFKKNAVKQRCGKYSVQGTRNASSPFLTPHSWWSPQIVWTYCLLLRHVCVLLNWLMVVISYNLNPERRDSLFSFLYFTNNKNCKWRQKNDRGDRSQTTLRTPSRAPHSEIRLEPPLLSSDMPIEARFLVSRIFNACWHPDRVSM